MTKPPIRRGARGSEAGGSELTPRVAALLNGCAYSAAATIGLCLALLLMQMQSTATLLHAVWASAVLIAAAAKLSLWWLFQHDNERFSAPSTWVLLSMATMLLTGITWSAASLLFLSAGVPDWITTFCIGALIISVTALSASFPSVSAAFALPALGGLCLRLIQGDTPDSLLVAGVTTLLVFLTLFSARTARFRPRAAQQSGPLEAGAAPRPSTESVEVQHLQAELRVERTRQEQALAEVHRATAASDAANLAKDEFLATMSHEIRTPLNGILPLLEILAGTELDVDQRDYLETAIESSGHLLRIIDDILDYSKIEAGKLELETVGINIKEVTSSVTELMSKAAEAKGLTLKSALDPKVRLIMRGDPVRLRQVLTNLVSNAIKFTDRGQVLIKVSHHRSTKTHSEIVFSVKDSGIGMNRETADRLFKPFSQGDASTTRTHGGTGLGLVICKRLVDLMDGKIGVKSELGKGSIFWFAVPLLKSAGDIAPARSSLSGARALLIIPPGSEYNRTTTFLDAWGISHQRSDSSGDALNTLRKAANLGESWAYDLLIIDRRMLGRNLIQLLKRTQQDPLLVECRTIIVGEADDLPDSSSCFGMPTPVTESQLYEVLCLALGIEVPGSIGGVSTKPRPSLPTTTHSAAIELGEATQSQQLPEKRDLNGRVLLVEDNPVNQRVAIKVLEIMGLTCVGAANGQIALETMREQEFDLIFMDCQMPVLDGYEATGQIRQMEQDRDRRTPIIAMTANAMAGDRQKCLDAGMDDYLSKPLNRKLLHKMLSQWLPDQPVVTPPPNAVSSKEHLNLPTGTDINQPAIDPSVIADLVDVMGEDFSELIEIYLQDSPAHLKLLQEAGRNFDLEQVVGPAHSMKSSSANVGAMSVSNIAKILESGARQGSLQNPSEMIEKLSHHYAQASAELRKLLS